MLSDPYLEFALEHPVGSTPLATGLNLARAEGVASFPDRLRLALDMEASGAVMKLEIVVAGEQAYMTNLFSGDWESVQKEQIPFRFDLVTESVANLLAGMEDLTLLGDQNLAGKPAYVIRGEGPTAAMARLIPGALSNSTIPIELWLDKGDGRLRQLQLSGPLVTGDLPSTTRVVRLEALDQAPAIAAPGVGGVEE